MPPFLYLLPSDGVWVPASYIKKTIVSSSRFNEPSPPAGNYTGYSQSRLNDVLPRQVWLLPPGSDCTCSTSVNQDHGQGNVNDGNEGGLFLAINAQCIKDEGFLTPKCQEWGLWRGLQTQDSGSCVRSTSGPGGPGEGAACYSLSPTFCMRELEVMVTSACCYMKINAFPILNKAAEKVGQATSCPECHRVQGKGGSGWAGDPTAPGWGQGVCGLARGPHKVRLHF